MFKEFKSFVLRGNVVDLAVAVIIGGAFSAIIGSLVNDVITPLILKPILDSSGVAKLEDFVWNGVLIGKFLSAVINFLIIATVLFIVVKSMNQLKKKDVPAPETPKKPTQEELLTEIRDLLKNK